METSIIVRELIGYTPYWVVDENLPKARARFKRLTGKYPSKKAIISVFIGKDKDLDRIQVNDMGDISYPKEVIKAVIQ